MEFNLVINSTPIEVAATPQQISDFLSVAEKHQWVIPSQATQFSWEGNTFRYTIPGTGDLSLLIQEVTQNMVRLVPYKRIPFPFQCDFQWSENENHICTLQIVLMAELNSILKLMATKPLQNLTNTMAQNIQLYFQSR